MKRAGLRVALAASGFTAIFVAGACQLDFSSYDSQHGADAASTRDGGVLCDGATCGFCATHPPYFFCDDWDEGGQTDPSAGWTTSVLPEGGVLAVALDASVSPPGSLLATGGAVYLEESLPNPSTLKSVHIEVDVETTCTGPPIMESGYRFIVLHCDDATYTGGDGILQGQDGGTLGFVSYSSKNDAGQIQIDGGGNGNGAPSTLALTSSWSHLALDLTPPFGVAATLGSDGGSDAAFAPQGLSGYGCPHPTTWSVSLGMVTPGTPPSCNLRFDNFILNYTSTDGTSTGGGPG